MTMLPTPPGLFVGRGPADTHRKNRRLAMIRRRHGVLLRRAARQEPTIEHAGNPDYDIAQLPEGLVGR